MKAKWSINKFRKGRLVQAVALLFLFHTAVDLLAPQFCSEEPINMSVNQHFSTPEESVIEQTPPFIAAMPGESDEEPTPVPCQDEDCFCCCTHVMASFGFVNPAKADLKLLSDTQRDLSIPSAPPNNPYHPPRFA
jgi:hypothetical protein